MRRGLLCVVAVSLMFSFSAAQAGEVYRGGAIALDFSPPAGWEQRSSMITFSPSGEGTILTQISETKQTRSI